MAPTLAGTPEREANVTLLRRWVHGRPARVAAFLIAAKTRCPAVPYLRSMLAADLRDAPDAVADAAFDDGTCVDVMIELLDLTATSKGAA